LRATLVGANHAAVRAAKEARPQVAVEVMRARAGLNKVGLLRLAPLAQLVTSLLFSYTSPLC